MTWWNRKSRPSDDPRICPLSGHTETEEEKEMKYKLKTDILHEIDQRIQGNEPFLSFQYRPRMIVQLSGGFSGSHIFFEGYTDYLTKLMPGTP
jgi:hypothetical protein